MTEDERKEKARAYMRQYRRGNPEKVREIRLRDLVNNREKRVLTSKQYREDNKELLRERRNQARIIHKDAFTNYKLKCLYGITLADYNLMVEAQAGKCAVCHFKPKKLFVDHCHATNYVRGLLCGKCNMGIGLLDDKPEIIESALNYVRKHAQLRLVVG